MNTLSFRQRLWHPLMLAVLVPLSGRKMNELRNTTSAATDIMGYRRGIG